MERTQLGPEENEQELTSLQVVNEFPPHPVTVFDGHGIRGDGQPPWCQPDVHGDLSHRPPPFWYPESPSRDRARRMPARPEGTARSPFPAEPLAREGDAGGRPTLPRARGSRQTTNGLDTL